MKQECSGMVTREEGIIHFSREVMHCSSSSSSSLLKSTLNDMAFSKCSDICSLHVCKLCSNASYEFQFLGPSSVCQGWVGPGSANMGQA